MTHQTPITVIDRETKERFNETVMGEKWIRWAYQDANSTLVEKILFKCSLISQLMGWWYDSSFSKSKIEAAIAELHIDESEFAAPKNSFNSFNDFFTRHLTPSARPVAQEENVIVSPADGRVLVFPELHEETYAPIKGYPFSIRKLLPDHYERFVNGALAIVRLCPADYHRYHFPCDGEIIASKSYDGALHSVNPIALGSGPDVFGDNKRVVTLINTQGAGQMAFIEVGAFGVGSIVNTCSSGNVRKMDEKGFFKFGGSTVVVVFEKGSIAFSNDLVENSANGFETLVKVGQPLATLKP